MCPWKALRNSTTTGGRDLESVSQEGKLHLDGMVAEEDAHVR
jgi:hypothetical protein